MTLEEIEQLTAHCARAGIGEIELAQAGFSLRLRIDAPVALDAVTPVEMPKSEAAFSGVRAPESRVPESAIQPRGSRLPNQAARCARTRLWGCLRLDHTSRR